VRYAAQCADGGLGAAFSKDPGGKTMDNRTLDDNRTLNDNRSPNQRQTTGQARGNLMRLERDLNLATADLKSATRNRIVGGVILLIGVVALIQVNVAVGVVVLLIGGWVFVRALLKVGQDRRSVDTITEGVTDASAKLAEVTAQPSVAE
jgi:Flp pilus assembly protein TadB